MKILLMIPNEDGVAERVVDLPVVPKIGNRIVLDPGSKKYTVDEIVFEPDRPEPNPQIVIHLKPFPLSSANSSGSRFGF